MTSQKLNEEHENLRHFMAVVVSSAFRDSLKSRKTACSWLFRGARAGQILRVLALEKSSVPKRPEHKGSLGWKRSESKIQNSWLPYSWKSPRLGKMKGSENSRRLFYTIVTEI